jgi:hypothetical protein
MARPTVIVGKADAADAPQRKKKRRRAPRIVFPDPDRHRKPAKIHTYIREYDPMRHRCPLWLTQRYLMQSRQFEESCARAAIKAAREARKAARAASSSEESCATGHRTSRHLS